jgi:hypothetical protein
MENKKLSIDEAYFDQQYAKHSSKQKKSSAETGQQNLLGNSSYASLNQSMLVSRSGSQMQSQATASASSLHQP